VLLRQRLVPLHVWCQGMPIQYRQAGQRAISNLSVIAPWATDSVLSRWRSGRSTVVGISIQFVKFIPGPENTWTIQMTLHDNIMITALQKSSPAWGADPSKPNAEGVLVWDISDPVNPKQVSEWKTGATGTHRNSYPGGKYAYLSAGMPGYNTNILVILDVSDRAEGKRAARRRSAGFSRAGYDQP
jgi:hypothetical protein